MSTKAPHTPDEILEIVRPYIDRNQPADYRLLPREAWFSDGLDAWVVSVDFDRDDIDGLDFAKRLADIEEQVEEVLPGTTIHVHGVMWRED